ncbi:catechol 1,2-dioxygenase [Halomonas daqingensis]|uniref:dioxygenase family protein n=1 Tax=Billgrantia desiderata TaxID=52021 RepID=UPI001F2D14B3|nr:dioxygenase [Halomonas desiderata]MCE8030645.1 catechol 1,2-dioxygenase [Halomonas desiderata]
MFELPNKDDIVPHGIPQTPDDITEIVLKAMSHTRDERLREILTALVKHLHAFGREVKLSEEEFMAAINAVTRLGHLTRDRHNETMVMSDALGFSTLVMILNQERTPEQISPALLGPFYSRKDPEYPLGFNISRDTPKASDIPLFVSGRVTSRDGTPLPGALVEVWHASPEGLYENQDDSQPHLNLRGKFRTDAEGRYHFRTIRPASYPIPTHGIVGEMLEAQSRHPFRAAHLHFTVSAEGHQTLVTQIFPKDDPFLESDCVFGVTSADLAMEFPIHDDGQAPDPDVRGRYCTLEVDFDLSPGVSRLPASPIDS